jgi:hypothetical protein
MPGKPTMPDPATLRRAVREAIDAMDTAPMINAFVAKRALWLLPEPLRFGAAEPLRRIAASQLCRMFDPLAR